MLIKDFNVEKFGEIFPHMENILHCGLFIHDIESDEQHWSRGMFSILGVEPYSVKSTFESFSKYILPEDKERVLEAIRKSRDNKTPYQVEFSILNAKGIYKRIYAENSFRTNAEGQKKEYDGVIKDITESYFYKKALEQKVVLLDKSNQNLQEFVYIASHDLQEPLRKISTFTGRLNSKFENLLGEEGSMYISRILKASDNMQTLLEDLLSFSRLSFSDKQFETVSLKDCLESVLNDLEIKIEDTKAQITFDPLPEIQGFKTQLKQLFNNLINNAIKFRKPDKPPVIQITSEELTGEDLAGFPLAKDTSYVKIVVKDNGIGFEQEFSERIFMIFQRLNGKAEYAGSGIGLSICKKIADNHHGFISATGIPDEGSTFTVLLPQKQS
jgi:signal transduction histidine kinase